MRFSPFLLASFLALTSSRTSAAPHISSLSSLGKRCTNSASDRACWGDYDLSTDYYTTVPDTGVTVEVYLELVNTTAALDGVSRDVLLVNGTFPGPTIIANWGDTVGSIPFINPWNGYLLSKVVHLYNGLTNNGTGIHFHGIRQNFTTQNDGVPSVTQCPLAPGESITYTWRATQYGHTWYHSHFALQAWEGVLGGIIINGPATSNYDEDLGVLFLNDWNHETFSALYYDAEVNGPPTLDNGLINGTNVYGDLGSRFNMTFTAGSSYRIRLVNGAIDTHFKFMIDDHNLTVIAMDLVPIVSYSTQVLSIGMGQRYDIIVNATETSGNYWIRAIPQTACSNNDNSDNIKGILKYDSTNTTEPDTSAYSYDDNCDDEDSSDLVPYLSLDASTDTTEDDFAVTVGKNSDSLFRWYMAGTTFVAEWDDPTLLQIYNNDTDYTTSSHVIELDTANEWVYFIIETTGAVPHPIHLHGHDFYLLGTGTGTYDSSTANITLTNPPRRDVAMLPASGFMVIAFQTDNPGTWLMHCHIGWHTSEGFDLQLVERYSEISGLIDYDTLNSTCVAWDSYVSEGDIVQDDSGV
ncbi:related to laccase precursor [Phialocephala subalpina]|uniref:laccase n=1 Tax=Phialocephala subalpina TaxID=576137 RepID=A0A1L7XZ12_9HELO|nr:related to laccase precursor [Phialocephala subalpina]